MQFDVEKMKPVGCVLILALALCSFGQSFKADPPVLGKQQVLLDQWSLQSSSGLIARNVTVPGDLVSDLFNSKLIPDPHTDQNWLTYSKIWWEQTWTYQSVFASPSLSTPSSRVLLVLDGVKMGAHVFLNGKILSDVPNQFLRYSFDVTTLLLSSANNTLSIVFPQIVNNSTGINTEGRFMACSGGWDWSPYGNHYDEKGRRLQSRGIWKHVYLTVWAPVVVHSVVPVVSHVSSSSSTWTPSFLFNLTVHYATLPGVSSVAPLVIKTDWLSKVVNLPLNPTNGASGTRSWVVPVTVGPSDLWYPGSPRGTNLASVSVCSKDLSSCYETRVGFRSVEMVTAQPGSPDGNGSGNFTVRLSVNGQPILTRGANWIPSTLFEGRVRGDDLREAVRSAADAGMNVLRVWGGGVYMYEDFYEACDEYGIIIYHDMMITSSGMQNPIPPPSSYHLQTLLDEVTYQVRRLSPHPSIAIWDSCNECGVMPVFEQVFPRIVHEDISRIVWPASPSSGWASGVSTRTGRPLVFDGPLVPVPQLNWYNGPLEHHGPYLHGTGSPYVNDPGGQLIPFTPLSPPSLPNATSVGLAYSGQYISEFGCVAMSSDFSMNSTLSESQRDLHSSSMMLRNYPCDSLLDIYWGKVSSSWSLNLYACNVAQAIHMSGQIGIFRAQNIWGLQIWQLNEIWPTGGWGSLETASAVIPSGGQLLGGRWKPLHYALRDFLYRDFFLSCGDDARCFFRMDTVAFGSKTVVLRLSFVDVTNQGKRVLFSIQRVQANPFEITWFCAGNNGTSPCTSWAALAARSGLSLNSTLLEVDIDSHSFMLPLVPPASMPLPDATISIKQNGQKTFIRSSDFAAWVFITAESCMPEENLLFLFPDEPVEIHWRRPCPHGPGRVVINHAKQYLESK